MPRTHDFMACNFPLASNMAGKTKRSPLNDLIRCIESVTQVLFSGDALVRVAGQVVFCTAVTRFATILRPAQDDSWGQTVRAESGRRFAGHPGPKQRVPLQSGAGARRRRIVRRT